jgi:hypothetical protein
MAVLPASMSFPLKPLKLHDTQGGECERTPTPV